VVSAKPSILLDMAVSTTYARPSRFGPLVGRFPGEDRYTVAVCPVCRRQQRRRREAAGCVTHSLTDPDRWTLWVSKAYASSRDEDGRWRGHMVQLQTFTHGAATLPAVVALAMGTTPSPEDLDRAGFSREAIDFLGSPLQRAHGLVSNTMSLRHRVKCREGHPLEFSWVAVNEAIRAAVAAGQAAVVLPERDLAGLWGVV